MIARIASKGRHTRIYTTEGSVTLVVSRERMSKRYLYRFIDFQTRRADEVIKRLKDHWESLGVKYELPVTWYGLIKYCYRTRKRNPVVISYHKPNPDTLEVFSFEKLARMMK